jgi:hypothetical protein
MSFANSGIYTPPTGATNSTPGTVIRSATWNTVFTDIAAALTQLAQQSFTSTVSTIAASAYTVVAADAALIFNVGSTATVTMPTPSTNVGRWLRIKTVASQAVISSASVVAPLASTTPGTAICAATAGKYAVMTCDGTSWVIMSGN